VDAADAVRAEFDLVLVPAGEFLMGSSEGDPGSEADERPQHAVRLDEFRIGRTAVTNEQFARFAAATGHVTSAEREGWAFVFDPAGDWERIPGADWQHPTGPGSRAADLPDHPVVSVSWHDARAFCRWLNEGDGGPPGGLRFRLPTEAEWEKAARGIDGRIYPWGDRFEPGLCSHFETGCRTVPAGSLPAAAHSPYGAADMSGNTWDWTATLWGEDRNTARFSYPYDPEDGREDLSAGDEVFRIVRGGSFKNDPAACRSACRDLDPPGWSLNNLGFRVVLGR
jgi:formylglycine-generating enzyme required for sulfatase activity